MLSSSGKRFFRLRTATRWRTSPLRRQLPFGIRSTAGRRLGGQIRQRHSLSLPLSLATLPSLGVRYYGMHGSIFRGKVSEEQRSTRRKGVQKRCGMAVNSRSIRRVLFKSMRDVALPSRNFSSRNPASRTVYHFLVSSLLRVI